MTHKCLLSLFGAALLSLVWSGSAMADLPPRISAPTLLDGQYMGLQRALLDEMTRSHFGSALKGDTARDLGLLQRLLDEKLVGPTQTRELQAMGIVLGDLLAADLGMHWVIYEDKVGRSRALRYRKTQEYLFPVTMISRRREADNRTTVTDIYQKAYGIIDAIKTPLPFQ